MPPVMGFDDERVRDTWLEEFEREGEMMVVWGKPIRPAEGTWAAAMEELWERLVELGEALVEAFRPLMEVCQAIGEAVLGEIERVWALIEGGRKEPAGWYRGPRHVNCRCADRSPLPVERVDPVRAGRTRWWTRK